MLVTLTEDFDHILFMFGQFDEARSVKMPPDYRQLMRVRL